MEWIRLCIYAVMILNFVKLFSLMFNLYNFNLQSIVMVNIMCVQVIYLRLPNKKLFFIYIYNSHTLSLCLKFEWIKFFAPISGKLLIIYFLSYFLGIIHTLYHVLSSYRVLSFHIFLLMFIVLFFSFLKAPSEKINNT